MRAAVVIAPWLIAPQVFPSPEVLPWLFSLACLGLLALLWVSTDLAPHKQDGDAFWVDAWLLAALLSSVIGLCQYFGVSQHFPFMSQASSGEAFANLRQRNQFASLTSIGLLAALWWAGQAQGLKKERVFWFGLALSVIVLALGNAASSSRTGLLQLGLIAALALWWSRSASGLSKASAPLVRCLLLVAVGSYFMAALLLPVLLGQSLGGGMFTRLQEVGPACSSRLVLWSNVLHLIAQKPWLGWGWDELKYAHFITLYQGPRFCEILGNAHNLPLHLVVTLGLPVALLLCGIGVVWVARAQPWRETDAMRQLAWGVLAVVGLHSLLEYPLWYGPFQMTAGLCFILLWQTQGERHNAVRPELVQGRTQLDQGLRPFDKRTTDPAQSERKRVLPSALGRHAGRVVACLALAWLAGVGYTAWDYHRISQIYLPPAQRAPAYQEHTLEKLRPSWLFRRQVQFAELSVTPLHRGNAEHLNALAKALLHYSPEARVVEKLIESAVLLGRDDEALFYLQRYRAAYPDAHARWAQAKPLTPNAN